MYWCMYIANSDVYKRIAKPSLHRGLRSNKVRILTEKYINNLLASSFFLNDFFHLKNINPSTKLWKVFDVIVYKKFTADSAVVSKV